jgi:hypothetical protein
MVLVIQDILKVVLMKQVMEFQQQLKIGVTENLVITIVVGKLMKVLMDNLYSTFMI